MKLHVLMALVALCLSTAAEAKHPAPLSAAQGALLDDLDTRLLAGASATRTLETWCAAHRLAPVATIVAVRITGQDKPITAAQRARLEIGADEPVRYRRVHLKCGAVTLSEADNWYVPSRLTADMNAALDNNDIPFGKVVAPLGISRRTVSAKRLWAPDQGTPLPDFIIEHRALVLDRHAQPIAEVVETYTKFNIAPR